MADQHKKIEVKLKLLVYATKDIDATVKRKNERELKEKQKILEKTLEDIETMKYVVIEDIISKETDVEELDKWTDQLQQSIDPFDVMVVGIKQALSEIEK